MDLLLTHGYFLGEDPKEREIMRPYPPLGMLYLSSHLRARGFDVEIYDSTFGSRRGTVARDRDGRPRVVGIYGNLMTRAECDGDRGGARAAGCRVVLGGPEPANYAEEYLRRGRGCDRARRRRSVARSAAARSPRWQSGTCPGIQYRGRRMDRSRRTAAAPLIPTSTRSRGRTASASISRDISTPGESVTGGIDFGDHGARLPVSLPLVQPFGVRKNASAAIAGVGGRRGRVDREPLSAGDAVDGRRRLHHSSRLDR